MGRPRKNPENSEFDSEVTPQYQHQRKIIEEQKQLKANKPEVVSRTGEMAISSFNRRKYREVIRLSNGNVYRKIITKEQYDALPKG